MPDARAAIDRLAEVYPLRAGQSSQSLAKIWAEAMARLSPEQLDAGVLAYIRNGGRYFPKPGEVMELAVASNARRNEPTDLASRYWRWEQHHADGDPCPVCGARIRLASPEERQVARQVWDPELGSRGETRDLRKGETLDASRYAVIHDAHRHAQEGVPHVGLPFIDPGPR